MKKNLVVSLCILTLHIGHPFLSYSQKTTENHPDRDTELISLYQFIPIPLKFIFYFIKDICIFILIN